MSNDPGGDVAIFWDYENCHPPSNLSGYEIVQKLRHVGHKFGTIKLFKAYFELSDPAAFSKSLTLRSELQCSGVSLTDCPHNGRKDVADKMIMVDMLAYAIDNPAPSTIILISGDRDFAYAVSILRLRRYRVVIVSLSGIHTSLKAQASVFIDWVTDVLGVEVNEETLFLREEQRAVPLSPVKSRARKNSNAHQPPQSGQWSIEEEEVDIMTHMAAARSRSKSKQPPAPIPMTPRIGASQIPDSLPSVAEDESDEFSIPSRSPSRTESAPPALGETRSTSAPSTVVDFNDSSESIKPQPTPSIAPRPIAPEPPKATTSAPKAPSPQQKPTAKLDNTVAPSTKGSAPTAAAVPPSNLAKVVVPPPVSVASKTAPTTAVQSRTATSAAGTPQVKTEPLPPASAPAPASGNNKEAILAKFKLLIERLEAHRVKGTARPLRSTVAVELATRDNEVYRKAGVQRFSQYTALAEKEGVIEMGGREGGAWISLCPVWHGAKLS